MSITTGFDPTDYELPDSSPEWTPPRWLTDFVRDEIRPFLDRYQKAALDAWDRWLAERHQTEAWLQHLAESVAQGRPLDEASLRPKAFNEVPLELPLPLQRSRNYSHDETLIVALAVHDATRRPKDRIRSTERGLYRELCRQVEELNEQDLPHLKAMLVQLALSDSQLAHSIAPTPALPMSNIENGAATSAGAPQVTANAEEIDPETLAIALLFKEPMLSIPGIASRVSVDRTTLYK
jgi:hypothetical protein